MSVGTAQSYCAGWPMLRSLAMAASRSGTLHLVPVPIGNPRDITLRALDVLRSGALIVAEDTRHFRTLAAAHGITARPTSLHEHNEAARVPELLARLEAGTDVVLVSDAGTPVISDPGFRLTVAALRAGVPVTALPGASAVTTALSASGLPPIPFRFCGFPPRAGGARRRFFAALRGEAATLVCFEAPHRLLATLRDALGELGEREACLARNLTKPHERYQRGPLSALAAGLATEETVRGECTLLIAGVGSGDEQRAGAVGDAERVADILAGAGAPPRAVQALLTGWLGLSRRAAYEIAHHPRGVAEPAGEAPATGRRARP
jgi:16S rRNA (cytidine1402-2'-O)-methyltransferase